MTSSEEFKPIAGADKQVLLRSDERTVRHGESTAITLADGAILLMWTEHFRAGYVPPDERSNRERRGGGDDSYGRICSMISRDGGRSWGERRVAVDDKDALINCMSPALTRLADGRLLLAYSWRCGGNPHPGRPEIVSGSAQKRVRFSTDEGASWSEPTIITPDDGNYHTGCHDRAYTLPSGRVLVQIHSRFEQEGPRTLWRRMTNWIAYSDDNGRTWQASNRLDEPRSPMGFAEASVARRSDGSLLMIMRTTLGQSFVTESFDEGATWTDARPSGIVTPAAPSLLVRIPDTGHLLLIWNPHYNPDRSLHMQRCPLLCAISVNGGRSWELPRALETDARYSWDYPSALFRGGDLHLFYRRGGSATDSQGQSYGFHDLVHARMPLQWLYERDIPAK